MTRGGACSAAGSGEGSVSFLVLDPHGTELDSTRQGSSKVTDTLPTARPFAIRYENITKNYGATRALRGVSLEFTAGRVHALVGENGAGKSTFLGIASGRVVPTSGTITVDGEALPTGKPRAVQHLGIHTIYQELTIIPALTPQANVFLGHETSSGGWLKERSMFERYAELCELLQVPIRRVAHAGSLSVADQQMIEIMRAVVGDARALLFDEPTASLAHAERESLFRLIQGLKAKGLAIALVSHNLEEVLDNADTVTVFRDGILAESRPTADWTKQRLVDAMLGTSLTDSAKDKPEDAHRIKLSSGTSVNRRRSLADDAEPVLEVRDLHSNSAKGISFDLRPGEILGIAGLVGSGRTALLRALAGLNPEATAKIKLRGITCTLPRSVREARQAGIALLPEDRKDQGLVLSMTSADNITLGEWDGLTRAGYLSLKKLKAAAAEAAMPVGFDQARIGYLARNLSGGNQQKLMLARWIHAHHTILLADEPTRGVDIGAKNQILEALEKIVGDNRSMIVVSSELEEIVALSDRVLIINEGRQIGLLDRSVAKITVDSLLRRILEA